MRSGDLLEGGGLAADWRPKTVGTVEAAYGRFLTGDIARELWRASRDRDGLMIMLLACRPVRRETLAAMRLGEHLVRRGEEYEIALDQTSGGGRRVRRASSGTSRSCRCP